MGIANHANTLFSTLFTGLQSDGHPNFISALMAAVLAPFGVRATAISAPDQKDTVTAAKSERANQYVPWLSIT